MNSMNIHDVREVKMIDRYHKKFGTMDGFFVRTLQITSKDGSAMDISLFGRSYEDVKMVEPMTEIIEP